MSGENNLFIIKKQPTYRIAITGPESTGKTRLAGELAVHYSSIWVPEYARDFLSNINREYSEKDLLDIAKGQLKREDELYKKAKGFLFCDTDPLVCMIWSKEKFGHCDPWIIKQFNKKAYDLYLLCFPDLPWESDPLRENPMDRERLFWKYKEELEMAGFPFSIIKGLGNERLGKAIEAIDKFFFKV